MKKIVITGSTDGIGFMVAQQLIEQGHQVLLHARNAQKAETVRKKLPKAMGVVTADLSSLSQTKALADQVNSFGLFDAVIHNAAVGYREPYVKTEDGFPHVFVINSVAPYLLTCLIHKPKRLLYTSSGLHEQGTTDLSDLLWEKTRWNGLRAYSDTKLHDVLLAFFVATYWPDVFSNAVSPGWVATNMGGPNAPDSLKEAPETQVWLASSDEQEALVSGKYFYHKKPKGYLPEADNSALQAEFIEKCATITGVRLPGPANDSFT